MRTHLWCLFSVLVLMLALGRVYVGSGLVTAATNTLLRVSASIHIKSNSAQSVLGKFAGIVQTTGQTQQPQQQHNRNLHSSPLTRLSTSLQHNQQLEQMVASSDTEMSKSETEMSVSEVTSDHVAEKKEESPKMSMDEFRAFNKLAVMMDYYHNHFRTQWTILYKACETNTRPPNLSLSQFLSVGLQLIRHLTAHHGIEEAYIFPDLAVRMPEFRENSEMLTQHEAIHEGLDKLEAYLTDVKRGRKELRLSGEGSLKEVMDSFREVLWSHLDKEVENLGAANMRRYWSREEIAKMNY